MCVASIALYAVALSPSLHATSDAWTGASDATWANTLNWLGGNIPGTGDTATFNAASANTTLTLGAITLQTVAFNSAATAAYTLGSFGETLTLNDIGAVTVSSTVTNSEVVGASVVLGDVAGDQSFTFSNSSTTLGQTLSFTSGIDSTTTGNKSLTLNGAGGIVISGNIANTGGTVALTKNGTGTLTLSGTNSFGGGVTLGAGTLNINSATALGSGAGAFTINGGTINATAGATVLTNNNAQLWNGDFTFTGTNSLNLGAGAVTLGGVGIRQITVAANTLTVGGAISGSSGFIKAGAGTLTLQTTASLWTGNAIITAGTLSIQAAQSATASYVLNSGTTLTTNQGLTGTGNIIYANTGSSTFTSSAVTNAVMGGNGNVTFSITNTTAVPQSLFAAMGGTATWGNNNGFRLIAASSGTATQLNPFVTLDFANTTGGIFSRGGGSAIFSFGAVAGTNGNSGLFGTSSAGGTQTFIVGSKNIDTTFAGRVFQGTTNTTLIKVGTGTWTLTDTASASPFTAAGGTNFNGGTVKFDYATNNTGILLSTGAIGFGGGTMSLLGKTGANITTQTIGGLSVLAGGGRLIVDPNGGTSTTLTMGTLTTGIAGGTLNLQPSDVTLGSGTATITTTSVLTTTGTSAATSLYSSRFTYGSDWMTGGTTSPSTLAAYSSYADLTTSIATATRTTNDRLNDVGNATLGGNFTTNTLKITNSTAQSLDLGGFTLAMTTGSLLFSGSASYTLGTSVNNGTLKPTSTELILQHLGTGNLAINSVIANGSAASSLTKGGFGTLTLAGTNTYSGLTYVNSGTLSISSNANVGAIATGAGVNLNGGTLQATATFALDNAGSNKRPVNIGGGGGTVEVTGSNIFSITGTVATTVVNQFGPLIKKGTGTLILSDGNLNSSYSGATIISGGILSTPVMANGGVTSGIGNSIAAAPSLILDGGTLQYAPSGSNLAPAQSTDRSFTLTQNGGGLDASGSGALNFNNTLAGAYSGSGNRTLTLTGNNTNDNTLAAPLGDASTTTGAGGTVAIAKTGAGKWILSNRGNTYSGNTTISGTGTLALSAASTNNIASSSTINVGAGSTLDVTGLTGGGITLGSTQTLMGSGTISGNVTTVLGSTVTPGSSIGTLTTGAFTIATGTTFNYEFPVSGANDLISTTNLTLGSLTGGLTGGGFNLYQVGTVNKFIQAGTFMLFQYGGTLTGNPTSLFSSASILNAQTGLTYAFDSTSFAGFISLTIGGTPTLTSQWTSLSNDNWSAGGNWSTNPTVPTVAGDTANFTTAQTTQRTVTLDGSRAVGSISFDSTLAGYVIANGSGTLTLDNLAGVATIDVINGSHSMTAPVALSSETTVSILNSGDALTISGNLANTAGSKTITKTGAGTLVLSGANSYGPSSGSIGTTLVAGKLGVGSGSALGAGDLAVTGSATLQAAAASLTLGNNVVITAGTTTTVDTQANAFTLSGVLSQTAGSGSVNKVGTGTLVLSATNTYTGATTVSNGILQLGAGGAAGSVAGNIVNNATLLLNRTDDYPLGNVISGTGALTQAGTDNVILTAANTFNGNTVIAGGTLTTDNALALQNSTLNYNNQGGALSFGTLTAATLGGLKGAQDLALLNTASAAVVLTVGGNTQNTTYSGILSGAGASLTKNGVGTLTLTGNNSYSGATGVNAGVLFLGTGGVINGTSIFTAANAGQIQVNGGALTSSALSTINQGSSFLLSSGSATFNGGIRTASGGGDGAVIRVDGGAFTATTVTIVRTANPGAPNLTTFIPPVIPQASGFVVTNGTVNIGNLNLGDNVTNSSMTAYFGGGDSTVTNQIVLGQEQNNRWNYLQVAGGTLTAANDTAAGGIVIGKAGSAIQSELYLTGGTTTLGRIAFGAATDAVGGTAALVVNGGTLYVGAGGILNANTAGLLANTLLTAGTIGAAADWTSPLAMQLNSAGFTFKAADSANVLHDITLGGALTGTGTLTKTGNGKLTLAGTDSLPIILVRAGSMLVSSGADVTASVFSSIANQGGDTGSLTVEGTGRFSVAGDLNISDLGGSTGVLTFTGGNISALHLFVGKNFDNAAVGGTGTVNQTGGVLTVTGVDGLTLSQVASSGTYNLNGGTLSVQKVAKDLGTSATFNFNGGTLKAGAASATFIQGLTEANVKAGGGTIDTNGFNITIAQTLSHDPALGVTPDGGITKIGNGTLTLSGTQTYSVLNANGGTTNLASALGSGNSTAHVASTAMLNIGVNQTLASLVIDDGGVVTLGALAPALAPALFAEDLGGASAGLAWGGAQAVPEPGSAALLLGGMLALFGIRQRRE